MCGIAGIISATSIDLRPIQAMTEIQFHRGPDSGALLFFGGTSKPQRVKSDAALITAKHGTCALGHRRLAIIDTSAAGIQPMQCQTIPHLWISYNGEIYNYKELRTELATLGKHFSTNTDTEVVLHAFAQWGLDCFARFHGMWAMAILDTKANTLTLSRDRFGIKPLYLHTTQNRLAFASEIKALLTLPDVPAQLNHMAVKSYLLQHLVNHTNDTFFDGISAFPPAHSAVISLDNPTTISPKAYWHYPTDALTLTDQEASAAFTTYFAEAMTEHMRADVAIGSCLSGGLDSSAIVCVANAALTNAQRPFHTFTALFADDDINESKWINDVNAATIAVPHSVSPTYKGIASEIDALIWHQDEPFTSTSIYAQWCVMRAAKNANIPVLLDGQGADEIFCGYKKFYVQHLISLYKCGAIMSALRETFAFLWRGDRTVFRLRDGLRYLPQHFRPDVKALNRLMTATFSSTAPLPSPSLYENTTITQRQQLDLTHFSVPSLLRYEDRNSMAFSVESRVPFLDHRLVEFGLRLSSVRKMRSGITKLPMRNALKGMIPESVRTRRDKMGFGSPQKRWLDEGLLEAFARDIRTGQYAMDALIERNALTSLIARNIGNVKPNMARLLFQLYVLNRWMLRFNVKA